MLYTKGIVRFGGRPMVHRDFLGHIGPIVSYKIARHIIQLDLSADLYKEVRFKYLTITT